MVEMAGELVSGTEKKLITNYAAGMSISRGFRESAKTSTSLGLIDAQQQLRFAFG